MRMLDPNGKVSLWQLQLYLTISEAKEMKQMLDALLKDPEANEHETVCGDGRELSFSLLTEKKLKGGGYTPLERKCFAE
jgi:hypothetical protein